MNRMTNNVPISQYLVSLILDFGFFAAIHGVYLGEREEEDGVYLGEREEEEDGVYLGEREEEHGVYPYAFAIHWEFIKVFFLCSTQKNLSDIICISWSKSMYFCNKLELILGMLYFL